MPVTKLLFARPRPRLHPEISPLPVGPGCCPVRIGHCLLALAAISLIASSPAARAAPYVSGTLSNRTNQAIIPGAEVALFVPQSIGVSPSESAAPLVSTQTLPNGTFVLRAPAAGSYRLLIDRPPFVPINRSILVPPGGIKGLHIRLRQPADIPVQVLGPDKKPVAAGRVEGWLWALWGRQGGRVFRLQTASDAQNAARRKAALPDNAAQLVIGGKYLRDLPLDDATVVLIQVRVRGIGLGELRLKAWPQAPVTISLGPGASVSGEILDLAGNPIVGARIPAFRLLQPGVRLNPPGQAYAVSDRTGHFTLTGLFRDLYDVDGVLCDLRPGGNGERTLTLRPNGAPTGTEKPPRVIPPRELYGPYGGRAPLAPILERIAPQQASEMVKLSGRVTDAQSGAGVPDAEVALFVAGHLQPFSVQVTGPDGAFQTSAVQGAGCSVRVESPAYLVYQQPIQLSRGEDPTLKLSLHRVPVIQVNVIGQDMQPVKQGSLEVYLSETWKGDILEWDTPHPFIAGSAIGIPAIRWDVPLDINSIDQPDLVVIGVRSPTLGYGQVELRGWPGGHLDIHLKPGATISGTLVDPAGHPLPNNPVEVTRSARTPGGGAQPLLPITVQTRTDAAGRFNAPHIPHGTYSIFEQYQGEMIRPVVIHLTPDRLNLTIKPTGAQ